MNIAVLEMGVLPTELAQRHGGFFELIQQWLGSGEPPPQARLSQLTVCQGAALPEPTAFDGYIISGSKHSVYEDLPWINASKVFLNRVKDAGIPLFGICFGHQLMAEAFGGKVESSAKGWGVGVDDYDMHGQRQQVWVFHQDQIAQLPQTAHVLASSAHCQYGVLGYDFPAWSTQFHPEFTQALMMDLLARKPEMYGVELAQRALLATSQATQLNQRTLANQVWAFFQDAAPMSLHHAQWPEPHASQA